MNINSIIELLNKERGCNISAGYYSFISEWRTWWEGFNKDFHEYHETLEDGSKKPRKLYTLKMGKKVCEDWASILLNEKTEIVIDDKTSAEFVQGEDGTGGVLGANDFWHLGNALIEKAFYSGTGAFVLKFDGMTVQGESILKNKDTQIRIEYLPAHNIVPLTVKNGQIIECAFVSEIYDKGKSYIYLETHDLNDGGYVVTNRYFQIEEGRLKEIDLPEGIIPSYRTGSEAPLFSIIRPNIVNHIDDGLGLGISVFANAIDNLKGIDLAFNNFCRDFWLGGKKVFMSNRLTRITPDGVEVTPDDAMQSLFVHAGDIPMDENGRNTLMTEYNPTLRVAENREGLQAQLDYLSFKVGLGTKHYQFNSGSIVTATQYMGDKQELIQNAAKHYIVIEQALIRLTRAILWAGKEILGLPVNPDAKITINFEDSYVIDKESERIRDQQEVRDGLMQKWEYRVKWYGEDEPTAKKMVGEQLTDDELMGFGGGNA